MTKSGSIALIDYGAGNLTSVKKALTALGTTFFVPSTPDELAGVAGLIVPGVGNFAATAALHGRWREEIHRAATAGTPLLGICLGMQWLFEGSDEAPEVQGLGVMKGRIGRLVGDADRQLKIPHVGWHSVAFVRTARRLDGLPSGAQVYFTHSYAAPITTDTAAATTHRDAFASVVERDNIFGVQFHPEKSSDAGLQMLRNFLTASVNARRS